MTPDQIRGRELDAQVAHHVFGLPVEERLNARTGQKDFVHPVLPGASSNEWVRVAFYAESMAAAINVELALHERGWTRTEPRERTSGDVRVVLVHVDGRTVEATGPVNEALCRAALKAVT